MKKNSQFIKSFIMISCIFTFIFSSIFYLETKRLEKQKSHLYDLSKQEIALGEHLFSVARIQGKISFVISNLISKTNELELRSGEARMNLHSDISSLKNDLDTEILKSITEYRIMKSFLDQKDVKYLINMLSIDLYLIEMSSMRKNVEDTYREYSNKSDQANISLLRDALQKAQLSNEKVISTYKNEIEFISSNIQTLVTSSYNDIYQSNLIMSVVSLSALIGILLYTFFTLIIPLHNISNLTDRLLKNPHFIEDMSLYPGELQDVVLKLNSFTSDFIKKEEDLTQEKVEFRHYEKMKNQYYSQIQSEIERPMEILNNTLHRVHNDKSISSESRKLVELAEHEYDHLRKLLIKASEVSSVTNDPFQIKYDDTTIFEFINGEVSNLRKQEQSQISKKFLVQIDPGMPTNIYLDQKHVRQILEYAFKALSVTSGGDYFALNVSMINLHENEFVLFDLKLDNFNLKTPKDEKSKDDYLSTFSKHEANSAEFHIFQNLAAALGGTLDFKLVDEKICEFRLMLPLVGHSDLQNDLVG